MLRKSVVILTMLLCSVATQVYALGLGTVTVESALNQPLRVRIEILQLGNTRLQDITVAMASLEEFQRFDIGRPSFLSNIRFNVAAAPDGNFITLTSNQVVREPYLNFILDTRWPNGRLLSEHTILLDLPVFDNQQPSSAVRQPVSPALRTPTQPTVRPAAPAPVVSAPVTAPVVAPAPADEPAQAEPEVVQAPPAAVEQTAAPATPEPVTPEPAAPAPSPQPVVDSTPVQADAEPGTITTSPNETLSDIALRIRPDNSVSMQQTMLAIQRLNPDAFIGDNINRMRAGQILRVPGLQEIQTLDAREAAAEVSRQNQVFAIVDVQPLAAPATTTQTPSQAPQGQLSVVTSDANAVDGAGGAGQVNEVENAVLDQRISELENQLAQRQEEVDRARIEREEMNARLLELEDQIAAATEIIRLQDLQLAQLQDSLAQAAAEQTAIAAAEAQAADQTGQGASLVDDVLRILTGNLLFIGFGLALVVLLVVVLLLRRNRADDDDEEDLDELDEDEFAAVADRDERNDRDDRDSRARPGREFRDYDDSDLDDELDQIIGMGEGGDAVSQAAALLRQGKTVRAVSLLQAAVNEEPDDQDLRMKLLEALAEQGDLSAFEEQADMLDGSPDMNSRINELRDSIEFEELEIPEPIPAPAPKPKPEPAAKSRSSLFAAKPTTEEEDRLGAASFLDDLGIDLDAFDDDEEAPAPAEKPVAEPAPEPKPAATERKAGAPSLDDDSFHADDMDLTFDLAGDGDGEDSSAAKSSDDDTDDSADDTDGAFSFDADEDEDTAAASDNAAADDTSLEFELGEPEVEPGATPAAAKADSDIESFEFDVDSTPTAVEAAPEPELDLETFAFDTDPVESEPVAADSEPEEVSVTDEQSVDFEFDKTEIQPAKDEAPSDEMETFEFDVDEDPDATVVEKPAEDDDLDLDLDIEEFDLDDEETTTVVESKADNDDDDDFLDLDAIEDEIDSKGVEIELDLDAADPEEIADSDDAEEDLDYLSEDDDVEVESVDDVEEVEMLSTDDEAATKLELAYAYRKMGDIEGAKEILREVIKEGTQAQIKEANVLMASLDDAED